MKVNLLSTLFIFIGLISAQDNTVMKSLKLAPSAMSSGRADNGVANPVNAAMAMHFNPAGLLYDPDMKGFNFAFTLIKQNISSISFDFVYKIELSFKIIFLPLLL